MTECKTKEKYFIVRGSSSGAFAGTIKERNGSEVTMSDCRRLWYWDGAASLSQMAVEGVKNPENCKFTMPVDEVLILDAIEILTCTDKAEKCIRKVPVWKA